MIRAASKFTVKKAITHALDNKNEEFILSDYELDLEEWVSDFLSNHIKMNVSDDKVRVANFIKHGNNVRTYIKRILEEQDDFIRYSQLIASQLYGVIKRNKNISPADLIICVFEADSVKSLAILKMDYNVSVKRNVQELSDGTKKIRLIRDGIALPNINQKLQKCAFVFNSGEEEDYRILLLDRQINSDLSETDIAKFFIEDFLSGKMKVTDKEKTKIFIKESHKWVRDNIEKSLLAKETQDYIDAKLKNEEELNIREIGKAISILLEDENKKDEFIGYMLGKSIYDTTFLIDKTVIENRPSYKVLRTQGILLKVNDAIYANENVFSMVENEDGFATITIKNIKPKFYEK